MALRTTYEHTSNSITIMMIVLCGRSHWQPLTAAPMMQSARSLTCQWITGWKRGYTVLYILRLLRRLGVVTPATSSSKAIAYTQAQAGNHPITASGMIDHDAHWHD